MKRTLRHLLVAVALVFGQHAAQLHALSHLKQDVAGCDGEMRAADSATRRPSALLFTRSTAR